MIWLAEASGGGTSCQALPRVVGLGHAIGRRNERDGLVLRRKVIHHRAVEFQQLLQQVNEVPALAVARVAEDYQIGSGLVRVEHM